MALIGMTRRSSMCKICLCLDDDKLNELTLDVLYSRRTYEEIKNYYNQFMPKDFDVNPITLSNIHSHKRHSDISLIAEETLREKNKAVTEGDHAAVLFAERFNEVINKNKVLHSLYKSRINSIQFLTELMDDKKSEFNEVKSSNDVVLKSRKRILEKEIRDLIKQVDDIETSIQQTILQDIKVEKGPGNTYINQNFINILEGNMKEFMNEFIPYLLHTVFQNDIDKGKEVVAFMSNSLDKHLGPALKKVENQNIGLN